MRTWSIPRKLHGTYFSRHFESKVLVFFSHQSYFHNKPSLFLSLSLSLSLSLLSLSLFISPLSHFVSPLSHSVSPLSLILSLSLSSSPISLFLSLSLSFSFSLFLPYISVCLSPSLSFSIYFSLLSKLKFFVMNIFNNQSKCLKVKSYYLSLFLKINCT